MKPKHKQSNLDFKYNGRIVYPRYNDDFVDGYVNFEVDLYSDLGYEETVEPWHFNKYAVPVKLYPYRKELIRLLQNQTCCVMYKKNKLVLDFEDGEYLKLSHTTNIQQYINRHMWVNFAAMYSQIASRNIPFMIKFLKRYNIEFSLSENIKDLLGLVHF